MSVITVQTEEYVPEREISHAIPNEDRSAVLGDRPDGPVNLTPDPFGLEVVE